MISALQGCSSQIFASYLRWRFFIHAELPLHEGNEVLKHILKHDAVKKQTNKKKQHQNQDEFSYLMDGELYSNTFPFSIQLNECLFHASQNRPRDWFQELLSHFRSVKFVMPSSQGWNWVQVFDELEQHTYNWS